MSLLVYLVTKIQNYDPVNDLKPVLFNPAQLCFCSLQTFQLRSVLIRARSELVTARLWEQLLLNPCSGTHQTAALRFINVPNTFPVGQKKKKKRKCAHFSSEEENECDPGGANSGGRAPNTTLLVRPHTAHSVSSGRSGRSSLEIIKALISCQTPQRHPSITRNLHPPC